MSPSYSDILVLLVGISLLVWIVRRPLITIWYRATAVGHDTASHGVWRTRLLLATLTIPPAASAINPLVDDWYGAQRILEWIESVPILAWLIYVAWISLPNRSWLSVAGFSAVIVISRGLSLLAGWLGALLSEIQPGIIGFRRYSNLFWQWQWVQFQMELIIWFVAVLLLSTSARFFRIHLVRTDLAQPEPPRITIPYLLLMQTLLAVAVSVFAWIVRPQPLFQLTGSLPFQIFWMFGSSLALALMALGYFGPTRYPRWIVIFVTTMISLTLRGLSYGWYYYELKSTETMFQAQVDREFMGMAAWNLFSETIGDLCAFGLIGILYRKAGLVVKSATLTMPRQEEYLPETAN